MMNAGNRGVQMLREAGRSVGDMHHRGKLQMSSSRARLSVSFPVAWLRVDTPPGSVPAYACDGYFADAMSIPLGLRDEDLFPSRIGD